MSNKPEGNNNCVHGICDPKRTQKLMPHPPRGEQIMVGLEGPGVFLAAEVAKQGGNSGLTFVNLDIDGRNVTALSFVAAENNGLTQYNPYGIVLLSSSVLKNFTIGFPSPLRFERNLTLNVHVDEEEVEQILINIIHGTA
jgi:hypothetical protein